MVGGINNNLVRFLVALKNASAVKKPHVLFEKNKIIEDTCRALYREGLIQTYSTTDKQVLVRLRVVDGECVTTHLRVAPHPSKPSVLSFKELARINFKRAEGFLSTHEGVLPLTECKRRKIGGIFLFRA